jgi:hypothetical protein
MQIKIRDEKPDEVIPVTVMGSKEPWSGWMGDKDSYYPFPEPERILGYVSDDFGNTVICYKDEDGTSRIFIAQSIDLEWT